METQLRCPMRMASSYIVDKCLNCLAIFCFFPRPLEVEQLGQKPAPILDTGVRAGLSLSAVTPAPRLSDSHQRWNRSLVKEACLLSCEIRVSEQVLGELPFFLDACYV